MIDRNQESPVVRLRPTSKPSLRSKSRSLRVPRKDHFRCSSSSRRKSIRSGLWQRQRLVVSRRARQIEHFALAHVATLMRRMGIATLYWPGAPPTPSPRTSAWQPSREGLDPVRGTPDLQHRPRQPVHEPGIHRAAAGARLHISMDGKGCWVDNVFVERLWRSLKYEDIYLKAYASIAEANRGIGVYFDFYNSFRPHQSLPERMTPDELRHAADESRGIMPVISHRVARSCAWRAPRARRRGKLFQRSSSLIRLGFLSNQTGPALAAPPRRRLRQRASKREEHGRERTGERFLRR